MNDQPISTGLSLEEILEEQTAFMLKPPSCGERVIFRIGEEKDGQIGALFWFDAGDVQSMAEKMIGLDSRTMGFGGAARWTSLRDSKIESPTPVPSILLTFNQIAFKLIESGKGRVKCPLCDQTYEANVLEEGHKREGGYLSKTYSCPSQHELITTLVMHLLLRRDPWNQEPLEMESDTGQTTDES